MIPSFVSIVICSDMGKILLVLFIMCITIAINLVNPLIIERAVNVHIANRDMKGLMLLCLFGVGLNVVNVAGIKLRMYMLAKISNQVLLDIREAVYEHIQKLSFHFFDTRPTGKILARVIGDVNALKYTFGQCHDTYSGFHNTCGGCGDNDS